MEISSLPRDVLLDILLRLPVEPLIRFSLSSKQYLSLIHHPDFISCHLTRSKSNPSPDDHFLLLHGRSSKDEKQYCSTFSFTGGGKTLTEHKKFEIPFKFGYGTTGIVNIVGSSNGLVCMFDTTLYPLPGDIFLWNIIIGKFKKLPHPTDLYRESLSHVAVGFGYALEKKDFKVVQILYYGDSDHENSDVWVYSLASNTWRKIEAIVPCSMTSYWHSTDHVNVNGAVHWLAYEWYPTRPCKPPQPYRGPWLRRQVFSLPYSIMSFDLSGEVFKMMALPINLRHSRNVLRMFASPSGGGTLSLIRKSIDGWEVWLMQVYGVEDSWMKQFSINVGRQIISRPLKVMVNGDVLLETKSGKLVCYDHENQQMNDLGISGIQIGRHVIFACTSNLMLLDTGEKVGG